MKKVAPKNWMPNGQPPCLEVVIEVANNAGNLIPGESKPSGFMGPVERRMYALTKASH
jgi:hypothetical protein